MSKFYDFKTTNLTLYDLVDVMYNLTNNEVKHYQNDIIFDIVNITKKYFDNIPFISIWITREFGTHIIDNIESLNKILDTWDLNKLNLYVIEYDNTTFQFDSLFKIMGSNHALYNKVSINNFLKIIYDFT